MAISSATQWEVRAQGSDGNSGGFVAGASGTDYSQQAAAQYSFTDLATTTGTAANPSVTSASHSFVAADVGNILRITAGTSWTAGFYQIVSVSAGAATLDRACGSAASLTAGSYVVGGCFASLAQAAAAVVASNRIWIRSGSYSVGATNSFTASVSSPTATALPSRISGYYQTRGDITLTANLANRPLLTITASSVNAIQLSGAGYLVENLSIDCGNFFLATGITAQSTNHHLIRNNKVVHVGNSGNGVALSTCAYCLVHDNDVSALANGATAGLWSSQGFGVYFLHNTIHDSSYGAGIRFQGGGHVAEWNLLYNLPYGIQVDNLPCYLVNNVVYNTTGDGIHVVQNGPLGFSLIRNNILAKCGGYGINGDSAAGNPAMYNYDGNAFYLCTAGNRNNMDDAGAVNPINASVPYTNVQDLTLTADPFNNAAGGDFTLNNVAGGGAAVRGKGLPSYLDMGALQHRDLGGIPLSRMLGGV